MTTELFPADRAKVEALALLLGKKGAREMLAQFGEAGAIFSHEAGPKITGPARARVEAIRTLALAMSETYLQARDVLSSWSAVVEYLHKHLGNRTRESFSVVFLDRKNRLLKHETMGEGTVDHVPVYTREVLRRALELGASALILAHNHPSGDPTPSTSDVAMTKEISEAGRVFGIALHDHIIIGNGRHASLKQLGLI